MTVTINPLTDPPRSVTYAIFLQAGPDSLSRKRIKSINSGGKYGSAAAPSVILWSGNVRGKQSHTSCHSSRMHAGKERERIVEKGVAVLILDPPHEN